MSPEAKAKLREFRQKYNINHQVHLEALAMENVYYGGVRGWSADEYEVRCEA